MGGGRSRPGVGPLLVRERRPRSQRWWHPSFKPAICPPRSDGSKPKSRIALPAPPLANAAAFNACPVQAFSLGSAIAGAAGSARTKTAATMLATLRAIIGTPLNVLLGPTVLLRLGPRQ